MIEQFHQVSHFLYLTNLKISKLNCVVHEEKGVLSISASYRYNLY